MGLLDAGVEARLHSHQPRRTGRAEPALRTELRALPVRSKRVADERSRSPSDHRTCLQYLTNRTPKNSTQLEPGTLGGRRHRELRTYVPDRRLDCSFQGG